MGHVTMNMTALGVTLSVHELLLTVVSL